MTLASLVLPLLLAVGARAEDSALAKGKDALKAMAGCFLVDYSYAETEAMKAGYALDRRIYDVNKKKSVKEWIEVEKLGPKHLRLQHVLFFADLAGKVDPESLLRHQAEDWEYEAPLQWRGRARTHRPPTDRHTRGNSRPQDNESAQRCFEGHRAELGPRPASPPAHNSINRSG